MSPAPLKLSFHLTPEDHAAFAHFAMRRLPPGRKMRQNAWVFGVFAFLFYAASQWNDPAHGVQVPAMYALHLLLAAAVFGVLYYLLLHLLPPSLLRTAAQMGPRRKTLGENVLAIDDGWLQVANPHGQGRLPVAEVRGVGETEAHLFLWLGGFSAIILPKAGLDPAALAAVRDLFHPQTQAPQP